MMGQQQFAYKLTRALAATFMVLATGAGSRTEESLRSPDLQAGTGPQARPAWRPRNCQAGLRKTPVCPNG